MKEYKTINKKPDVNKFPIQKQELLIMGKILYITSNPSPNKKTFILTDKGSLYVFENNMTKSKEYPLKSEILRSKKLSQKSIKFQTDVLDSQIWTDKKGNHAIIKYKNVLFYYNPFMAKKVEELNLINFGNVLIQPFAVAFNDEKCKDDNTGVFLLSDYNSVIYELQLFLDDNKEMMRLSFGALLKLKSDNKKDKEKEKKNNSEDIKLFELEKDDRIMDIKIFSEKEKILILAITKKILFQFKGKKDIKSVFESYKSDSWGILKAVKKFLTKPKKYKFYQKLENGEKTEKRHEEQEVRETYKYSKIQLLNNKKEKDKEYNSFGFMSDSGYVNVDINPDFIPQNKFKILKYFKIKIQNEEKKQLVYQLMPKTVCESNFHIFFLYSDYLVVQNKMTNGIKHDEYIPYKFIDMYYNEDSIIIYNENNMYKISLENEYKNLYEDYIEKGDFKKALQLTKDDKYIRPLLHKLYADNLFDKKLYLESALEYAFSNEVFENVCLKFLNVNNISGLIRYMALIMKFRIYHSPIIEDRDREKGKEERDKQFIEKYLIHTWLLELLIEKYEYDNNNDLIGLIRVISRLESKGSKYLNSIFLYFLLNLYGKEKEFIEFAYLKKDYQKIITYLISRKKIKEALEQFKSCLIGNDSELDIKLKNYFYNYGHILIKENMNNTIDLLINYFRPEKPEELIRMLISQNFSKLAEDQSNYKLIINYIKDLMKKPYKIGDKEINITKNKNLHNLYILLISYGKDEKIKLSLYNELKSVINTFIANQQLKKKISINDKIFFDLNFAKKIFKEKEDQKSKEILCLIYYLLKQYIDSIDLAIKNNFRELLLDLTKKIPEEKLMKKIWLKLFLYEKDTKGLSAAKDIIKESNNMIKIEDVIPLMGDDEKLSELKDELKNCIENSERSVILLNKEINEFNESNNSINKDIELSEKKAIRKRYIDLKCSKCDKSINSGNNSKFFLFPCKHIFDLQCLIDTYMEFNLNNLGNKDFEVKVGVIKDLCTKISSMEERKRLASGNKEKFGNEEDYVLNNTKTILYNYLNDECLLCGQGIIESTQIDFGSDEKFEWDLF